LTVVDPDNAFPTGFTLLVSSGTNYTVSGTTVTPALNFAGTLTIPVRVNDGVNNSPTFELQLVVNQINDPPSFAAIANQQVAENTPAGSVTITNISRGPQEEYQQLTFVASSNNAAVVADPVIQYNGTGATAVLSYVVKPNTSGIVTITVVAIDNGSNVPPNSNSYSSTFQIEVVEINTAPTLNALNNITIMEDAEQQNVPLSGISAGAGESQTLTVAVTTNRPEYFDMLTVAYTSPSENGLLQFKTKPNVSGTAEVTVTVADNGPGVAPHINTITRKFSIIIQPVNDPPVFTSEPPTVAVVDEQYGYQITARDPDGDKVVITAPVKPSWLAFTNPAGNGQATLSGVPPAGVLGDVSVTLQINDAATSVQQNFTIYVNVRPTLSVLSLATEEDTPVTFSAGFFAAGYSDQNENTIQAVMISTLPASGTLLLNDVAVESGDTIASASLSQLRYVPHTNFFGSDVFGWNAFDGYHFSKTGSTVDISVLSLNDAPQIVLAEDTLQYEVNGEAAFLEPLIDIIDPDDDTLTHATVAFHPANYRLDADMLQFQNTANVRGSFDFSTGVLEFNGVAPLSECRTALRSIKYLHQNTIDPLLEPKVITFAVTDGETSGETKEKIILLQYTFVEFEIPSGFTPNGDQANDTWVIDRPGGGLEEMTDAIISIYNKNGVLVHRVRGFEQPWDGTMNGELLPADTYFYTIDLQLRNKKTYKGIVTILR
jgi:gliding motility-associated-like protein